MIIIKNPVLRSSVFALGLISLALGAVGAFLPLLPTTPFVLLAAWCFLKSSPRAHAWIYRQPLFGRALRDWEDHRSVSRSTKVIAISSILLSLLFIWLKVTNLWVKAPVTALLLGVSLFLATRRERRDG